MTGTPAVDTDEFTVRSPDGVELAVWVDGQGPPLVLVHGSIQDHTISAALVGELRDRLHDVRDGPRRVRGQRRPRRVLPGTGVR